MKFKFERVGLRRKNTMAQHHPKRAISLKHFLIQIGVRPECRVAALVVA